MWLNDIISIVYDYNKYNNYSDIIVIVINIMKRQKKRSYCICDCEGNCIGIGDGDGDGGGYTFATPFANGKRMALP